MNTGNQGNDRARARSNLGLTGELQVDRTDLPSDPSKGGAAGYPLWFRDRVLHVAALHGRDVAAIQYGVSERSIERWENRRISYRMTGGVEREALTGFDQLWFSICLFIYPAASADEVCIFIISQGGNVYSREQISQRCKELEITRKRLSKDAYDAFSPRLQKRVRWFWSQPPPLGISHVVLPQLIDIDETGFCLSKLGSNYGRSVGCLRVRVPRHYTRNDQQVNVIIAAEPGDPNLPAIIDGSVQNPRRWLMITVDNVDQYIFGDFMDIVCTDLETNAVPNGLDTDRVFMWDNLSVHNTAYVTQIIQGRPTANRFRTVNRPPYHAKIAPIEYVICELACELDRRVQRNWTAIELRQNIEEIASMIGRNGGFQRTFVHCGY
jgi:hypothetical protein